MYQIYEGKEAVALNRVTAIAVKKYIDFVNGQIEGDKAWISSGISEKIQSAMVDGTISETSLVEILSNTSKRIVEALSTYLDEKFIFEWLPIIFNISDTQEYKQDWETKLSLDEFLRGMNDFFLKLNPKSNKSMQ